MFVWVKDLITGIKSRLVGTLLVLDEEGNVLIGPDKNVKEAGDAHNTISQRLARMRLNGSKIGCVGCAILTWIQNHWPFNMPGDHCTMALSPDSHGIQEVETPDA